MATRKIQGEARTVEHLLIEMFAVDLRARSNRFTNFDQREVHYRDLAKQVWNSDRFLTKVES